MIKTILILGATFSIGRIAFYYVSLKLKEKVKGKKRNYAEDIINKQFIPTILDEEEKEELDTFKKSFSYLLKHKKITRSEILKVRDYIRKNVKYPKKQFNNDAHEIFSACCHGQWEPYCIQQLNNYLQKIEDRI